MCEDRAATAKQNMAELYSRVAPSYAERGPPRFAYAGRRLVELAGVGSDDAVLDLGTGRGAALLPAAERVGPMGRAIGIDLAPGMVEQTATVIAERGLTWANVRLMDAEHLEFPDESFSHVLCSFAVFFLPDLSKALAEVRRVLRPTGVVGFAFERDADPRWSWCEEMLRACGVFERMSPVPGSGPIREKGVLIKCLDSAGFLEAKEVMEEVELFFANEDAWWESLWTHGSRRALEALTPDELAEVKAMTLERARSMATTAGVPELHNFVYVLARRG